MLGRRQDQEDCVTFEAKLGENHPNVSVFAVFDGHYGPRTALFMANVLQERVRRITVRGLLLRRPNIDGPSYGRS